jgi:hypothetical protein
MKKTKAQQLIKESLAEAPAVAALRRWAEITGISERELRRLSDEGYLVASQDKAGRKGSPIRITRAAIEAYLLETVR